MDANKSSGVSKEREQQIERISRCLPCHLKSFRQLGKPENGGKLSQLTFDNLKEIDSVAISFFSSEVVCLYNDNDDDHSGLVWFG